MTLYVQHGLGCCELWKCHILSALWDVAIQMSKLRPREWWRHFFLSFLLAYSWFTMLCYFQVYGKVNQLYIYIYPLFFRFFSHIGHHSTYWNVCHWKKQAIEGEIIVKLLSTLLIIVEINWNLLYIFWHAILILMCSHPLLFLLPANRKNFVMVCQKSTRNCPTFSLNRKQLSVITSVIANSLL